VATNDRFNRCASVATHPNHKKPSRNGYVTIAILVTHRW